MSAAPVFPRLRWVAAIWLVAWGTSYAIYWGWANFLHLCDIAVILTCLGLWRGNSLLISSQALSSLVPVLFWDLDAAWRLLAGSHLMGGTEYLWDNSVPLAVRLLSLFHIVWPPLLLSALARVRYNPQALWVQTLLASIILLLSRFVHPEANLNFVFRDPFLHRTLGPAWLHMCITAGVLVAVVYWPTHKLLAWWFPQRHEE